MKAITDFAATREHIAYAVRVFAEGEQQERIELAALQNNWASDQVKRAWFNKNFAYWLNYAEGNAKGEAGIGSYCTSNSLRRDTELDWYSNKRAKAEQLLKKFDCAVDTCEATEVILSDDDLSLLSVSLQSALGG